MENKKINKTGSHEITPIIQPFLINSRPSLTQSILSFIEEDSALEVLQSDDNKFREAISDLLIQLKCQLKKIQRLKMQKNGHSNEQIVLLEVRIKEIMQKITKIKQINHYCTFLSKKQELLEVDVEKFMFYCKNDELFNQKIESFFSEPIVYELLFKQYSRSYNSNLFVTDLINFFHELNQLQLLAIPQSQNYYPIGHPDLAQINRQNIIFRQICDTNEKYCNLQKQLNASYIDCQFWTNKFDYKIELNSDSEDIDKKINSLNIIAEKIKQLQSKSNYTFSQNSDSTKEIIILPQEIGVFESLEQSFETKTTDINSQYSYFLLQLTNNSNKLQEQGFQKLIKNEQGNFSFLRDKIIKTDTKWHLNRILSAFNICSHLVNILSFQTTTYLSYTFTSFHESIKYEFNAKRKKMFEQKNAEQKQLKNLAKNWYIADKQEGKLLFFGNVKAIYPSAIHNFYYFVKFMMEISRLLQEKQIFSQEFILQILQIKADEICQWATTCLNLYQIIKNKYFRSYPILLNYIKSVFNQTYENSLEYLNQIEGNSDKLISKFIELFIEQQKKSNWVSQIVFQFDTNADISQVLECIYNLNKLQKVSFRYHNSFFYEKILHEIIQTRNNLKFDRCYSFNSLHELFGYFTNRIDSFQEMFHQLTPLCHETFKFKQLLRFFGSQIRIKREVFKAELYWITIVERSVKNKFIINNNKKSVFFKDFLQQNCKFLLNLSQKELEYLITNIDEVERSISLFAQEVDRLKLIQCSLNLMNKTTPLIHNFQNYISGFSYKQLTVFFTYLTRTNYIHQIYGKKQKKEKIASEMQNLIVQSGKLNYESLHLDCSTTILKIILSDFIFLIESIDHLYEMHDCISLFRTIKEQKNSQEILRIEIMRSRKQMIKTYDEISFMELPILTENIQFYEYLLVVSLLLVQSSCSEPKNKKIINQICNSYYKFESFLLLNQLNSHLEAFSSLNILNHLMLLTKIKCILVDYQLNRSQFSQKSIFNAPITLQNICLLTQVDRITRRLIWNKIMELKHLVLGKGRNDVMICKTNSFQKLRNILDQQLLRQAQKTLIKYKSSFQFNLNVSIQQNIKNLEDEAKLTLLNNYEGRYNLEKFDKKQIVLFDEFRGFEIEWQSSEEQLKTLHSKKQRKNLKKGMLNGLKQLDKASSDVISQLQKKVNLQIVKESLPIRKLIYKLQLEDKRMRDQIAWQTCKLEHNVVQKINRFIQQSSLDQKQSLINFKYTVNLQTIKGIENVIHERTEIFSKATSQPSHHTFITEPKKQNTEEQETLLDINVKNVFAHVKKLRLFAAWKRVHVGKQDEQDQWHKFSKNVQSILHNSKNMEKMRVVEGIRKNCLSQNILCSLIQQQNDLLNTSIREAKLNHLNSKVQEFRSKHNVQM